MPEDNNTSNNSNQGVAWYVKPTSDTIDFIKGIPVNVLADPDNVKVFDNYVKIKSGGLNMVIPIVDAVGGIKAWDEAICKGSRRYSTRPCSWFCNNCFIYLGFWFKSCRLGRSGCWRYNIRYHLG